MYTITPKKKRRRKKEKIITQLEYGSDNIVFHEREASEPLHHAHKAWSRLRQKQSQPISVRVIMGTDCVGRSLPETLDYPRGARN